MTNNASPDLPDLASFFQDWANLWREEMRAQASDPDTAEMWRAAIALWANVLMTPPAGYRDSRTVYGGSPRSPAAVAAPDPRDAEIERLARRVDELEARLARLEAPRRRRS